MANRIWSYHFGQGIVDTPNNFGAMGGKPSHPELLEFLATQFIESGWSVKQMHRLIMFAARPNTDSAIAWRKKTPMDNRVRRSGIVA